VNEPHDRSYEHQPPRRPSRLPRRTAPPPERAGAPDLRILLFVGLVLVGIVAFVAIPYLVQYLVLWLTHG
jgi:hypothetical protein